ncbi:formyltransferase family protein [Shewanella algae]|uniref:formyltransferase family protein n=1 Tax=Shewanella algae TaxID=38313 RepID=UPI001AAC86EF|nr:formyltransferase family protein [Shewanella algae]MBO2556087.1 hypothetical protein [Shewanella algae]MBO2573020.1 hypothetical protein [Shewanella algae]MBO2649117.1 hypothetical protein [Shewanella algae]
MIINKLLEELEPYMLGNECLKSASGEFIFSESFWQQFEACLVKKGDLEPFLDKVERFRNVQLKELNKSKFTSVFCLVALIIKAYVALQDLRYLNIALKLLERSLSMGSSKGYRKFIEHLIALLVKQASRHVNNPEASPPHLFTEREVSDPRAKLGELVLKKDSAEKVIVFSPNPKSNYTLAVLSLLESKGISVSGVVVRKLFNPQRIMKEFKRDGSRLVKKVYRKIILNDSVRQNPNGRNLSDTIRELGVRERTVFQWCKNRNIEIFSCNEFNDEGTVSFLKSCNYDFGVFTGGGILSPAVLDTAKVGILNCHAGLLPYYRGMDVVEWPVLLGARENTGCTVHFMSKGVDQGKMLLTHCLTQELDIKSARYEIESYAPYLQVIALIQFLNDGISFTQKITQGKHFFVMHPSLYDLALKRTS